MLRVSFYSAPECVDADCWNRFLISDPHRCTRDSIVVVDVVVLLSTILLDIFYIYIYIDVMTKVLGPNFYWPRISTTGRRFLTRTDNSARDVQEMSYRLRESRAQKEQFSIQKRLCFTAYG